MTKRIEQSPGHGHHNPRRTSRIHVVAESPLPLDAPEEPTGPPPTLTLVGGTDITPRALEPIAIPGT
jgi:hypothetical protein